MIQTSQDVLLIVLAVCLSVLTFVIAWAILYIIAILRKVNQVANLVATVVEKIDELVDFIQNKLDKSANVMGMMITALSKLIVYSGEVKTRKSRRTKASKKE